MKSPDVLVIIPALDEEDALPGVLAALPSDVRVVVVDNGSEDRTAEVAAHGGAEVLHEPVRGYGSAVQRGLSRAQEDPPAVVVVLDADHADDPSLLHELVRPILAGQADLVLADRSRTAVPGAMTPAQVWGNRLAVAGIRQATGRSYNDMGPFRALSWDAVQRLDLQDRTWGWNVEMQLKAARLGLRVVEMPLPYRRRAAGRSKISGSVIGTVRAGYRIVVTLVRHGALRRP